MKLFSRKHRAAVGAMFRISRRWRYALSVAAILTIVVCGVSAQAPRVEAAHGDDLRAVYANAADIAEGRRVADADCAGCHGANGLSTTEGTPNLAGQRPAYLYLELRAYQAGARNNATMTRVVQYLKDDALVKVAAYYASVDPAQPTAVAGKATPPRPDPVQAGKTAAAACAGCHGETGVSKSAGTPSLAGLDPKYTLAAIKEYKGGQRKNEIMKSMVASLSDADAANVALYYALQKPTRAATPAAGDVAAGQAASAACAACHGAKGVSSNAANPSLAGQDAQYLAAALHAYKDGSRGDETMKGMAASLDEAAVKNVSAFYASQQPQPPGVRKPLSTAEWAQRCDRCHGPNGNSQDPRLPALAAQRVEYLDKVLRAYRSGERKSPQMAAMTEVLADSELENLAAFYARQKPRAAVFVVVPAK